MAEGPRPVDPERRQPRRPRRTAQVAARGADRPPYLAALRLLYAGWGARDIIDGRLLVTTGFGFDHLSLRELVNVTYALQTEALDKDERREFDMNLTRDAEQEPVELSRNVDALMAAYRIGKVG